MRVGEERLFSRARRGIVSNKSTAPARFALGNTAQVRSGVTDPDFPDIPLGGWVGRITEVEEGQPPLYLVRWRQDTLKNIHPVYRKRCERDGLDFEEMWLGEDDLEPDRGGRVVLEQPKKIVTPPLSMKDQDDRIRAVFGLTRDDLLPDVDEASQHTYYKHLVANLKFPFAATWVREAGMGDVTEQVTILALGGFEGALWIDDMYGILCQAKMSRSEGELPLAEMEKVKGQPNKQLVEDYAYWFWNNQ
jgi:Calcium binding